MLRVVLCNCSPDESERLARGLVDEGLAACVNVVSGVQSYYVWEGESCRDEEDTLLIKTTDERYDDLKEWLDEAHAYDVPEIVALEATDVLDSYLDWTVEQTQSDT